MGSQPVLEVVRGPCVQGPVEAPQDVHVPAFADLPAHRLPHSTLCRALRNRLAATLFVSRLAASTVVAAPSLMRLFALSSLALVAFACDRHDGRVGVNFRHNKSGAGTPV